ncbi:hypothetical protein VNI00_010021 [Paramarasmius palmivorus]|uniref:Cytochrome P450 n=1 Tax=Paramarasmius palmivorus TaxID=297713 RepID=A0AAW0CMT3_9AGAR
MTWTIAAIILVVLTAAVWFLQLGRRESYLPPGPPTLPVLGNIHIFPTKYPHYRFTEWARQYGTIYSLKIGSQTAVVLNTMEHVRELLDRRNATTANRPRNYVLGMVEKQEALAYSPAAGALWRAQRKIANSILNPSSLPSHLPIQYAEVSQMLNDILHKPEDLCNHLNRYTFSVTTSIIYGKRCPSSTTREMVTFYEIQHTLAALASPGTVPPVDKLPILAYIPERWAPWKKLAKEIRQMQRVLYSGLFEECERRITNTEDSNGCFVDDLLGQADKHGMDRKTNVTTSSLLKSLVLLLVESPEVQRKAYEEVDRVVGTQRAPVLDDYKHLPYVDAIIKEVQRLRPVVPLGLPHEASATEEYLGYAIPKNTTIFANVYGINHDPEYFDDPESFRPERYLLTEHGTKPGVDDRSFRADIGFGFGRRACPGINLAKNSVALVVMNLIWAFEFKPLLNPKTGNEVAVALSEYEEGLIFTPKSFQCRISPRNKHVVDTIGLQYREAAETFSKFK